MSEQNQPLTNQHYSPQIPSAFQSNDEIDLRELFKALWKGKLTIVASTIVFAIMAVVFALSKPNVYQANANYILDVTFYGTSGVTSPYITPEYLASESFKNEIIKYGNVDRIALEGVDVSYNRGNHIISVSQLSLEPLSAFESVNTVGSILNGLIKKQELNKVELALSSLEPNTSASTSLKTQEYLDEIIAQQMFKKAMLEKPSLQLIKMLNAPTIPTSHIQPRRAVIVVLGALLGGMLGVAIVLIRFAFRREDD
ncbi:Wzz/FepE/Etk N-terminal domain-containing protein [Vibrio europaeus]|uniref:Wzz/FepE/Etk N-terminal domain-containing protein n=1 Tax=Vibrio europaeus TaxID=300876 RepID=UPI0039E10DAA